MTLKELRAKLARLQAEARAKKAEIKDGMADEAVRAIETTHAELLRQIDVVTGEITAAEARMDDDEERKGKRKRKAKKDEDGDDGDDGDDDDADGDSGDRKKKRKRKTDEDSEDCDDGRAAPAADTLTRAEAAEIVAIEAQARGLGIELKVSEAVAKGDKPDALRKRMFEELAKRSANGGPRSSSGPAFEVEVVRDESEGRSAAMEIALVSRILSSRGSEAVEFKSKHKPVQDWIKAHEDQARQYRGMGFVEIAAECIGYRGHIRTPAKAIWVLERAFQSTSDYPAIFQNVLNKSLLARYELATPTYREIAQERPFNDFRPHPQIRAGDFPLLQPVQETGELKYGGSTDTGESVSVAPYGVIYTISRQMIVNDELGAIDQILGSAGDMVLVFENVTFYVMFNSNPTLLQDSTAVFAAGHNNLASGGGIGAPAVATIAAARQALRQMKSISGNFINVPPRIILTGPVQETAADQMIASITPTLTTSVNPFSGRLRGVSDSNISDNSWYILAEPGRVPCFVYGFLNGATGPRVRTHEPFGVQGVKISVEHDFGCGAIDYRGFYKNPGA